MLIDASYFTAGPRHIQSTTMGTFGSTEANVIIEGVIAFHQPTFLCELFGERFGRDLNAYFRDSDSVCNKEYENIAAEIRQPFADYVFFHILGNNTQATATGLVRLKRPDEYAEPISRQVAVWNSMAKRLSRFKEWCTESGIVLNPDTELLTLVNTFNL